ncbi:AMP-binding protein [Marinomonas sp. 5E14-1]|uniref:ApeI family dehydratase n=1 Tax=Marinomonas sp. 5E14-1 TaxID=3153922 RepID=UPI0032652026
MSTLIPLSRWLLDVAEEQPIAVFNDIIITKAHLSKKVAMWQTILPLSHGQKWAVFHSDAIEFFTLLLALWQSGCTACIPGDNCTSTVERLKYSVAGFLGEFEQTITSKHQLDEQHEHDEQCTNTSLSWIEIERLFPAIEVYTSGSTGEPKPIPKNMAQIDDELSCIETLWPLSNKSVVLSTVTHQHLFGLTFRLFWSLATGRLLLAKHSAFSEDIYHLASQYEQFLLISTPAHLKRLNNQLDWSHLKGRCEATISSAAPLQYKDSQYAAHLLHSPILEVYGSSETGAIAWRNQTKKEADYWTLLPNITLDKSDEGFTVKGPHISTEHETLSDNIEHLSENCFRLHGRSDRIVKVEGKRLSLSKVEKCLEESNWICVAKALVITKKREEVAIVAELNDTGKRLVQKHSQKWLATQLKESLKASFEPVLLPRRWRFVNTLPYNQQGKLPMESLQALFEITEFETAEVQWPRELARVNTSENTCRLDFHIPKELIYFDGHFEKAPILPGIAQTHWAIQYARDIFAFEGSFVRLEVVKFQSVIFPNAEVSLELEYDSIKSKVIFKYVSIAGVHSSGRICFE